MAQRCRNEMRARREADDELRAAEARLATAEKTIAALKQQVAAGAPEIFDLRAETAKPDTHLKTWELREET